MVLALNFLLTILIELPVIAFFFNRRKRLAALQMALLINIISWSVAHIIIFSTDIQIYYIAAGLAIGEAIAFYKLLDCNWKKAIILSLLVNGLSFFITQLIPIDADLFQPKPEILRNVVQ